MNRCWLGIDPGKTGAWSFVFDDRDPIIFDNLKTLEEQAVEFQRTIESFEPDFAVLEKVNSFGMGRQSAFTFGEGCGVYKAILAVTKTPFQLITPATWQKGTCGKTGGDKLVNYQWLIRQYPELEFKTKRGKLLDGRTDALSIALYAKKIAP